MKLEVQLYKKFTDFTLDIQFNTTSNNLGILGASGCGKSMTLKCIAGLITPDKGRIVLNDRVLFDSEQKINLTPQQRNIGYLFQSYALFNHMSIEKNIECGLLNCSDKEKGLQNAKQLIKLLQLDKLLKLYPKQLSSGQQQRVAIARMLCANPELILFDEPFSALDSYLKEELQVHFNELFVQTNKSFIMVTHSRDEVYSLCDDLLLLDKGQVIDSGKINEVFANPGSKQAAILTGCKNIFNAHKNGNKIYLPNWEVEFDYPTEIVELCAIGIRAHDFMIAKPEGNYFAIKVGQVEEIESPFEYSYLFYSPNQQEKLWWKYPKHNLGTTHPPIPELFYISLDKIMLFTK